MIGGSQAISLYRPESDGKGRGNLVSCAECWTRLWLSLLAQSSAFLPPPRPLSGRRRWHPRSPLYASYPALLMLKEFPFPDASAPCSIAVKNIWSPKCYRDEAILKLLCPLLPLISSWAAIPRGDIQVASHVLLTSCLDLHTLIPIEIRERQNPVYLASESLSLFHGLH